MNNAWRNCLDVLSDNKELIPEFYIGDGSLLTNVYGADLGKNHLGEQGGDVKENKNKIDKKIKAEVVEEKNIKDEAVQRLKILQKGVKSRQFFLSVRICAGNGFLDCWYLQGNQMGRLCSAVGSNAQNGDFSQNLRILHW